VCIPFWPFATPFYEIITGIVSGGQVNVTREFIRGAEETLKIAWQLNIKEFIAKSGSPSCGCGRIYDGTFSGKLIDGDGSGHPDSQLH